MNNKTLIGGALAVVAVLGIAVWWFVFNGDAPEAVSVDDANAQLDADLAAAIAAEQPDASPADIAAAVAAMKTEMKGGATPAAPAAPEQAPVAAVATPPPAPAA